LTFGKKSRIIIWSRSGGAILSMRTRIALSIRRDWERGGKKSYVRDCQKRK